jgi:hypothetical protein
MKKKVILPLSIICGLLLFSCNDDDLNNQQKEEIQTTTLSPRTYEQRKENSDSIQIIKPTGTKPHTKSVDPEKVQRPER